MKPHTLTSFKKKAKFPKYHSKKGKNTFTVPQFATIEDDKLWLPKFKSSIPIRLHREVKGKIGKVSLTKTPTGKYFVSVFTTGEYQECMPTNKSVGIDLGLKDLLITSDGEVFKNNRYTKRYEKKLTVAQKHLSRKKKGSNGYEKQRLKVAKLYEKVSNCRMDYLHKCSHTLISNYDTICIEDLNVKGMVRNHKLRLLMFIGNDSEVERLLRKVNLSEGDNLNLPETLDNDRARKYFIKAIKEGWMEKTATGFKWLFGNRKGKTSVARLGYFLQKVYCPTNTEQFPATELSRLFGGTSRLDSANYQIDSAKKPQQWRAVIDRLFEK